MHVAGGMPRQAPGLLASPVQAKYGACLRTGRNEIPTMITIRPCRAGEGERAVEIWRSAVDATHDFLLPEDRRALDELVCGFLPHAPLWFAADANDHPLAFMLVDNGHMEALFVDPAYRGMGIGAALVRHGLALHPGMTTDVNEQNGQAVRFYEKMGFRRTGRAPLDGQGRPYPLIHLKHGFLPRSR
ncbi:putative N-acetyltransferase YjaB [bacterium YEK0313]|nr:putative N-acetyltransferase YjaB [bacterium YEK0313]